MFWHRAVDFSPGWPPGLQAAGSGSAPHAAVRPSPERVVPRPCAARPAPRAPPPAAPPRARTSLAAQEAPASIVVTTVKGCCIAVRTDKIPGTVATASEHLVTTHLSQLIDGLLVFDDRRGEFLRLVAQRRDFFLVSLAIGLQHLVTLSREVQLQFTNHNSL